MIKNKIGLKSVEIILAVIVVGLLIAVGYLFISKDDDKKSDDDKITNTTQGQSNEQSSETSQTATESQTIAIDDLGLQFEAPTKLGTLTFSPIHLEGGQALNSVTISSEAATQAGCAQDDGPLGVLTYDRDKGGTLIANARSTNLYYIEPTKACSAITGLDISTLQSALESLVSDGKD